jgi:cystathionine gamma-synthase
MSAVALVLQLLKPGDLVVATHDCYGGTHRLLTQLAKRGLFEVEFVDLTGSWRTEGGGRSDGDRSLLAPPFSTLRPPALVWIETPSNPLLRITDIRVVADAAHAVGAIVVADNTFLSPAWQQPIHYGADIVVHSTTKYLNGHSDVVGGAVVTKDAALGEELAFWANALGVTGAPFDSYLTLRGIRTLQARCRVHAENAQAVVELLTRHPAVSRVCYPGLPGHPGHAIARRQPHGFGAMVSFELHGGESAVRAILDGLENFTLAESLGGVESLVAHPATMTHVSMGEEGRRIAGISDTLLRLSVGIEETQALQVDLNRGLARGAAASCTPRLAVV